MAENQFTNPEKLLQNFRKECIFLKKSLMRQEKILNSTLQEIGFLIERLKKLSLKREKFQV